MALEDLALGGGVLTHMAEAMSTMPSVASMAARAIVARNPFFMAYFLWPVGPYLSLVSGIPLPGPGFYLLGESMNKKRLTLELRQAGGAGKTLLRWLSRRAAWTLGQILPLSTRKDVVTLVGRQGLLPVSFRFEFAMGMLADLQRRNPVALHRFLWSNHLAFAASYEVSQKFGASHINPTRHALFHRINAHLRSRGVDPARDIRSVLEIGCSQGYLLRHLETEIFHSATILHGLDLDSYAIRAGSAHLSSLGSKVDLFEADMVEAERIIGSHTYDIVLCCGVLMYVDESIAEKVIRMMFSHVTRLVGLICLAPSTGGVRVERGVRASDGAFMHAIHPMIRKAGGKVLSSYWVGREISGSSPSHVIVAEPMAPLSSTANR
jgi:SAM-dependent methyltransferase